MKFRQFTKPGFLSQIGRDFSIEFLGKFRSLLQAKGIKVPGTEVEEKNFYGELRRIFETPEGLPDNLIEALFLIEEMANDQGQERLENAAQKNGLKLEKTSSHGDIAMQIYLANVESRSGAVVIRRGHS